MTLHKEKISNFCQFSAAEESFKCCSGELKLSERAWEVEAQEAATKMRRFPNKIMFVVTLLNCYVDYGEKAF